MNSRVFSVLGSVLALIAFLALNIWSNATLTSWRLDLTEHRLYTLSEGTRNILGELDEAITLRLYYSQELLSEVPELSSYGNRVRDMLEEYAAHAGGKLLVRVIDPEPFSEAEDLAVAYGLRQLPFSAGGEVAYFGLVGTNTTDDEITIPFFQPREQESLEYDLTKLVYDLANPKKRIIGVMTALPMFGGAGAAANPLAPPQQSPPWSVIQLLEEHFELRELAVSETEIPADIDTLLVVHPKQLDGETLYAIDQFILTSGKAMLFVDPFAESDSMQRDPTNPLAIPTTESDAPTLLEAWGLKLEPGHIVGDFNNAIRVAFPGERGGRQEIEYLPWLALGPEYLNSDDFVTNQLSVLNLGSSGALVPLEDAEHGLVLTPLISSSPQSMLYETDAIRFNRNPATLLTQFRSADQAYWLAVRVTGKARSAFPDGKPIEADEAFSEGAEPPPEPEPSSSEPESGTHIGESAEDINVIVVADTDLLADQFWVQKQNFLGLSVPSAFADNGHFLVNAVDNLGGNSDLISLRSRGTYSRPFDRVTELRRQAEAQFRDKEQALLARLDETRTKLAELQQQRGEGGDGVILSSEQRDEIEEFRKQELKTRKELRAVQHDLRKNIEKLGSSLKFINIGLIPLLIGLLAVTMSIYRFGRQR
jgi:ABC-type uncharacterized transport system involved in gliding motility auxiliary subunit